MNRYQLTYTTQARRDLERLDKSIALRIVFKIKENSELSNPLVRATALAGRLAGRYRYRIGDYRAVFRCDNNGDIIILTILRIKHRREVCD